MKLLFVWPSAEFSTYDVAVGIHEALETKHELVDYRLYNRIKLMTLALHAMAPQGELPSIELACFHASEALPLMAIKHATPWAFAINGMGLHPDAVLALRRIGVRVAVWFTEAPYDTNHERELYLAQFCDVAFVNERTSVAEFQDVLDKAGNGGVAHYLAHAYRPALHRPWTEGDKPLTDDEQSDVLMVGSGFSERQVLLEAVDWAGIDLKLGGLWTGIAKPSHLADHLAFPCLDNADTVRLYHGAKIALNPHRSGTGAESANPRTYEVAACGTFQIADYRAEIADLLGDAVPMYHPGVPWQLSAMIRRYLGNAVERTRLAALARKRIQGQTFAARADTIIAALQEAERRPHRTKALPSLAAV